VSKGDPSNLIDVINLQRKVKLDILSYRRLASELKSGISEAGDRSFSVAFISDDRMKQLNETFRGKAFTTDVLSFPLGPDQFNVQPPATAGGSDLTRRPHFLLPYLLVSFSDIALLSFAGELPWPAWPRDR